MKACQTRKRLSSHSFSDESPESLEAASMLASQKKEDRFVSAELWCMVWHSPQLLARHFWSHALAGDVQRVDMSFAAALALKGTIGEPLSWLDRFSWKAGDLCKSQHNNHCLTRPEA
jgi:hypothetical protein